MYTVDPPTYTTPIDPTDLHAPSALCLHIQASSFPSSAQVDSLKMVVRNSSHLNECRNSFLSAVGKAISLTNERTSSHENVADRINDLKVRGKD